MFEDETACGSTVAVAEDEAESSLAMLVSGQIAAKSITTEHIPTKRIPTPTVRARIAPVPSREREGRVRKKRSGKSDGKIEKAPGRFPTRVLLFYQCPGHPK
jgi:hypothetical protein